MTGDELALPPLEGEVMPPGHVVAWSDPCPVCGGEVDGYEQNRDVNYEHDVVEVWPGGPMMPDYMGLPKAVCTPWRISLLPCGCELPDGAEHRFFCA